LSCSYDLARFVAAQAGLYAEVTNELRRGRKQTHWMWFIFPQIAGLGFSAMSQRYAISSSEEASAYLAHPLLGARLVECTKLVLAIEGKTINAILGAPDDQKFQSCMTLFAAVSDDPVFTAALDKYYAGARDARTVQLLAK
jgi:uncharacterized protein (DUF1810 family)